MSSPITKIVSSRSISSRSASWRAARNKVSGIAVHLPLARVHVAVELVDRRVGAFIREANDLFDLAFDVVPNLLEVAGRGDPGLLQLVLEEKNRVASTPPLFLLIRAVLVRVDHGVAPEPVVDRLDESWLRVAPRLLDELSGPMHHLQQVHAVDRIDSMSYAHAL